MAPQEGGIDLVALVLVCIFLLATRELFDVVILHGDCGRCQKKITKKVFQGPGEGGHAY